MSDPMRMLAHLGLAKQYNNGQHSSVGVAAKFSVEVHQLVNDRVLCYHVGKRNEHTFGYDFDSQHNYDSGMKPSVDINNNNIAVEIHETSKFGSYQLWLHVGELTEKGDIVGWGVNHGIQHDTGANPNISINDKNIVVEVHQSESHSTLWYNIGVADAKDHTIAWHGGSVHYGDGTSPAIALGEDFFVEVHSVGDTLYCCGGRIVKDESGFHLQFVSNSAYDHGLAPDIAIVAEDNEYLYFIETHLSQNGTGAWQRSGYLRKRDSQSFWFAPSTRFDRDADGLSVGASTVAGIAMCTHSSSGKLYQVSTPLSDTGRFFEKLLPQIRNLTLKQMVFAGSHNSGLYHMNIPFIDPLSATQEIGIYEQLLRGVRYFDLRVGTDRHIIRHGCLEGPLMSEIFRDFQQFFDEGHKELVIINLEREDGENKCDIKEILDYIGAYALRRSEIGQRCGGQRLANIQMEMLIGDTGHILLIADDEQECDHAWKTTDLRIRNTWAGDMDEGAMIKHMYEELNDFDDSRGELLLFAWFPSTGTGFGNSKGANARLIETIMTRPFKNQRGKFPNIIQCDYVEYARVGMLCEHLIRQVNGIPHELAVSSAS